MKETVIVTLLATQVLAQAAAPATITVQTDQSGVAINPGMWGIFLEDINFGVDGGIYAELVKNRSFEFPDALMGWTERAHAGGVGKISIATETPINAANPHYLRIESASSVAFGVANEGFRGIGFQTGERYDFSAQVRARSGSPGLLVELVTADGRVLAQEKIEKLSANWAIKKTSLQPNATVNQGRLNVLVVGGGTVELDMVSLFPHHTWKHRPGGLRPDLAQLLADLKPGFMRFPGGCVVEGSKLANRFQWKTTIGPMAERKLVINRWNDAFATRPAPDYFQSFGFGFFEYFQLCEDLGAAPLPILNCGMACQFNSGELCQPAELGQYVQDALDLVEFANGPADSAWGAKRAAMGHAKPFGLKMLGIGNEQWGQAYIDRYAKFHAALKAKYPEIKLVACAGPAPEGEHFQFAWSKLRELQADIIDEHSFANPSWFFANTHRYDRYDRNGPKVFFGEFSALTDKTLSLTNLNNLGAAVAEAAWMTGLERNGDVVRMASYAPLFAHIDGWQWKPELIWFDNLRSYGTPSYYVQKLFANNPGDVTVPVNLAAADGAKLYASATRARAAGELILKVVNGTETPVNVMLDLGGATAPGRKAKVFTLTGDSALAENSFAEPTRVIPQESKLEITSPRFEYKFSANSLTVLRFKIK